MSAKITCTCGKQYTWSTERAGKRAKCKCGAVVTFPKDDPEAALSDEDFEKLIRDMPEHDTSESGQPIYRHEPRTKDFEPAFGDSDNIEAITKHIEKYIGSPDNVFHEIISDLVHIDVHIVAPTEERNWYTLITSGMSDRPMTVPDDPEMAEFAHAELLICLPADWPLDKDAFEDERNYWPIRWLKMLARMPHEYDTWLGWGHTVPNGDPPEPFDESATKFCCWLLMHPVLAEEGFQQLRTGGKVINFYAVYPLYKEEVDFKLKHGAEKLMEKFEAAKLSELMEVGRKSTCKKFMGLF